MKAEDRDKENQGERVSDEFGLIDLTNVEPDKVPHFAQAKPVSEWISVEDRLPNQSSYPNLLLYSPEFGIAFGLYNGSWFESPMIDNDEKLLNTITHYQNPLPPALKELNNE